MDEFQRTLNVKKEISNKGFDPEKFCLVPFTTIILEPDGQVGSCRHKGSDFPIGNIKQKSIHQIWNDFCVKGWREDFLSQNAFVCNKEIKHQKCNLCSENNSLLKHVDLSSLTVPKILKLTANFNGKCNLQCVMCDIYKLPNGLYTEENFWIPARREIFPYLLEVDMLSGEPFIQTDTFKLIDEVSRVNPNCLWNFTTNAHWKFNKAIEEKLDKIEIKNLIVSIDGFTSETYGKIRYPGKLDVVIKTVESLVAYRKKKNETFKITNNFLVQKDNWDELPLHFDFCKKYEIRSFPTFLYEPEEYSLCSLNENELRKILDFWFEELDAVDLLKSKRVIFPIIDKLNLIDRASYLFQIKAIEEKMQTAILSQESLQTSLL